MPREKKAKSAAHQRMAVALAIVYLEEVRKIMDTDHDSTKDCSVLGKAQQIYKLETDCWDLLSE